MVLLGLRIKTFDLWGVAFKTCFAGHQATRVQGMWALEGIHKPPEAPLLSRDVLRRCEANMVRCGKSHHFAGWFSQQSSIDRFVPSNPLVKSSFCHGKMTMKTGGVYPSFCRRLICHKLLVIPWYQGDSSTPIVQIQFFQVTILQWKIPRLVRWFPHFLWGDFPACHLWFTGRYSWYVHSIPSIFNVFTMFFLIVGYTPVIWRFPRIGVPPNHPC